MLLFSSAFKKHKLSFNKLSTCMEHVPMAAKWAEDEWGYIRNKGVEFRKEVMTKYKENVYIGCYAGEPVAMFALLNHPLHPRLSAVLDSPNNAGELMYVYVRKEYRDLGFGKQIIEKAKQLAKDSGAKLILLDTLKPNLNGFYKRQAAEVVCEGSLFTHGTDVLRMTI
jgi:GNAT superfamily N-acetyltransferase